MDLEWIWMAASVALLLGLAYYRRKLGNLIRWLSNPDAPDPPRAYGRWDDLHALLHRLRRDGARREADLTDALARWRAAARALPDGVVILDHDRIAWCNDVASNHFGIDVHQDVDRPIAHLVRIPEFIAHLEGGDYSKPVVHTSVRTSSPSRSHAPRVSSRQPTVSKGRRSASTRTVAAASGSGARSSPAAPSVMSRAAQWGSQRTSRRTPAVSSDARITRSRG